MSAGRDADGDQLPDTMTLKPDRPRWFLVFAICAGFVAIAVWIGPNNRAPFYGAGEFFLVCGLIATPLMFGLGADEPADLMNGFRARAMRAGYDGK